MRDFNPEWAIPRLDRRKELANAYHSGLVHGREGEMKLRPEAFTEKDFYTAYCEGHRKGKDRPKIQIIAPKPRVVELEQTLIPGTEEMFRPRNQG